jgi:dTDP-4-dehydrorhamnose 3,5-epimerase-like enzyme
MKGKIENIYSKNHEINIERINENSASIEIKDEDRHLISEKDFCLLIGDSTVGQPIAQVSKMGED